MKQFYSLFTFFVSVICFSQVDSTRYYYQNGNYNKAILYGEKVKKDNSIPKTNLGILLNHLALSYSKIGDIKKAEINYLEELEIEKSLFGENHAIIANTYRNLGNLLSRSNELDKSEKYLWNAINILKNNSDYKSEFLGCLSDLASVYKRAKKLEEADKLYQYIIDSYPNLTLDYYKAIYSKAIYYFDTQRRDYAEKLFNSILADFDISSLNKLKIDIKTRNDYFFVFNLALLYKEKGDEINSKYYIELINNKTNYFFDENDIVALDFLYHSSIIYSKDLGVVDGKIEKLNNFVKNFLLKRIVFFNDYELISFVNNEINKVNYFSNSFLQNHPNQYPLLNSAIYENQLLLKNLSLRNQQRIKATIEKNGDTNLKEKYQQFLDNKRYITKIDELPVAQRPATYNQLKAETESLEKEITRLSSTFAEAKKSLSVTWKQIQEKLKPNEVVIDLVSFNYYNTKWTDSTMYGAFVIKKDSKFPKFVSLFEEKQLAVLLERNNKAHDSIQSKIINKQYSDKEISDLFYKPLEAELKNSNTIYLAPSGLAYQINFKALPVYTNQTLGEKYKLILLGTSATLIDYKPITFNKSNDFEIILYGGINYNKKQVEVYKEAYPNELNDLATRSEIKEFGYLKGTVEEINKIHREASKNQFKTTIKAESAATEESVKQLSGKANPFILHLATHGFFFENTKQELSDLDKNIPVEAKKRIYLASEDPMMRSGLLLAGANNSWRKTNNETNADDGILTAKEIANLDLSNCKLVVLSACETGLGQINGSEGVFGLQRAFKMAGVQNIIMSLWKVPDAQTAELFENFYAACFSGKSIQEAFSEAQNKMKEKYSPYYWAGFVLLE